MITHHAQIVATANGALERQREKGDEVFEHGGGYRLKVEG
jgi:hypothetical protein